MSETQPNPTELDLRLGRKAREFAAAADAVEQHEGPKAGPEFERKIAAWREAYDDLRRVAGEHPGEAQGERVE